MSTLEARLRRLEAGAAPSTPPPVVVQLAWSLRWAIERGAPTAEAALADYRAAVARHGLGPEATAPAMLHALALLGMNGDGALDALGRCDGEDALRVVADAIGAELPS